MLRLRRYRVFLFFATVIVYLFVRISKKSEWIHYSSEDVRHILQKEEEKPIPFTLAKPKTKAPDLQFPSRPKKTEEILIDHSRPTATPPLTTSINTNLQTKPSRLPKAPPSKPPTAAIPPIALPDRNPPPANIHDIDEDLVDDVHPIAPPGRQELLELPEEPSSTIHWQRQTEHFPVATGSLIHLPTGKPVKIPRIQYKFDDETRDAKISREKRQAEVRAEFQKAWTGYRKYAWLHDELSPVSGQFRDPFCGWAATLVDALDTLWIMDLKEEFEEAVGDLKKIDFTTSPRGDIPMFETTIRYLGGLVAAYDVSEGKYSLLLDKAIELAEVLMGAFDTPNRMPVLYYRWKPAFASQPHRASQRANLAELGSLSLEFTRLAQITKEPRYYDAVARVTDALSEWQDRGTPLDGVFPENVDASGCNRTEEILNQQPISVPVIPHNPEKPEEEPTGYQIPIPETVAEPKRKKPSKDAQSGPGSLELQIVPGEPGKGQIKGWEETHHADGGLKMKRQLSAGVGNESFDSSPTPTIPTHPMTGLPLDMSEEGIATVEAEVAKKACKPQGLESTGSDKFSMGGGQDSTYEYFPKQYLLLGGLEGRYRKMFNMTMNAVRKHMLYRPMVPGNVDILFSGSLSTYPGMREEDLILTTEVEHLTCFIGGMVGLGAMVFDIAGDLELAKKLTDGCVWAYQSTSLGIMPEGGHVLPCQSSEHCIWNETYYHEALDPMGSRRDEGVAEYEANKEARKKEIELARVAAENQKKLAAATAAKQEAEEASEERSLKEPIASSMASLPEREDASLRKRQLGDRIDDASFKPSSKDPTYQETVESTAAELQEVTNAGHDSPLPLLALHNDALEDPSKPLTHAEYVASRIKQENLPKGYTMIRSARYILRPEAIESVWYMYRITGDKSWQDKGWNMFTSIRNATSTEFGNSAIADVTANPPYLEDEMESFWLSETLKYFYLLYSTPDTISLDDWVLNTEAHPFKRPA